MPILNKHFTFLLSFACLLTFSLLHFYQDGSIILGGEGNFIIDYSQHLKTNFYQWLSRFGLGNANLVPSANMANTFFLALIQNLFDSEALTSFVLIFSMYFLPFLGMYLITAELRIKPYLCGLVSLFYVINPFSIIFLNSLNQWNNFSISLIPFLFWIVLRNYHDNLKLFLYFGSVSALFSFAYTNHPLNVIIHISTILSVYITSYYYNKKFILPEVIKKYLLVFSAFLLFNCWWLLNMFNEVPVALALYKTDLAINWLIETSNMTDNPLLARSLSLTHLEGIAGRFLFKNYFNTPIIFFIGLVPIFLVISGIFFCKKTNLHMLLIHILILMLVTVFFLKGASPPFGGIYLFLFEHVPFFNIFKTPAEKFGLLYTFLLSLLIVFTLLATKNSRYYKTGITIFTVYLLFCMGPLLMGDNIISDTSMKNGSITISRKYNENPWHKSFKKYINNEKLEYKVLSLPGVRNYQVLFDSSHNKKYSGLDPLLHNINKGHLAAIHGDKITSLYHYINDENSLNIFGSLNIGKFIINEDLQPWFGLEGPDSKILRAKYKNLLRKDFGNISTHSLIENFIPIVHTTGNIIILK
jgi:hypothetical protein